MHRVATVLSVVLGLLAVSFIATPVFADDDVVDEKRIQIWTKGDDRRELDITDLDDEGFERLYKQMLGQGYTLKETRELRAHADGHVTSRIRSHDAAPSKSILALGDPDYTEPRAKEPSIRRDLRELIRRGGTLPDDYRPEGFDGDLPPWWTFGSRGDAPRPPDTRMPGAMPGPGAPQLAKGLMEASGRLLLRYLEVMDDPVRGPVYASVLKDVGEALVEASESGAVGVGRLGMRLMPKVVAGLSDPTTGPVHQELMEILMDSLGGPHAHPALPGRAPRAAPRTPPAPMLAGASMSLVSEGTRLVPQMGRVPKDSLAAKMTLAAGDRILAVDGQPVDPAGLAKIRERIAKGGQLTLRVRRKTGETEVLDLEFAREDAR